MSYFRYVILGVFALSIIAGVAIFAMSKGGTGTVSATVVVWGTIPEDTFSNTFSASSLASNRNIKATYVRKDAQDFDSDFVEALAEGTGPDVVILSDGLLYKNRNKLVTIPYKTYSERIFKDTFIEEGEIFLSPNGIVAIPFTIDPIVMYWNRDLFANNQISQPPIYWEQMPNLVNKLTKKDSSGNVFQSTLAFGEWSNVTNAKEIVSMLLLQAGTPITARSDDAVVSVLDSQFNYPTPPGQSAIDFYTQFSNQTSSTYTWNRSLPNSLNSFLSGNLAIYFGYASELFQILQKNSNLNYDVAVVPQIKDTKKKVVFGRMQALAITKQSKQVAAAFAVINALTEPNALLALEKITSLPPVRRDMLANAPADAYRNVFYNSALISHTFIDPNPTVTAKIFKVMIESITSGKSRVYDALSQASAELNSELQ
jgi:ABC-type glycerol-3-phosphate transport system substrate-binding protein